MPTIYLTLAGPQQAPYPNGGDEAYWMGQVAGALVSHLNHRGIPLAWGRPEKPEALWLALSSQAAPPEQEGQKKGPLVLFQEGDPQSQRMAACLAAHLAQGLSPAGVPAAGGPAPDPGAGRCPLSRGWPCTCCTGTIPRTRHGSSGTPAPWGRPWPRGWRKPAVVEAVCSLLWGWHVLAAILAAGAFFTLETGFYQLRCAGRWLKAALCRPAGETGKLSSFQALSTALAGSIGTGNIVGVAAAITVGGPGALFWMWASALLGMMTIYAENALAARYRTPGAPGALGYIRRAGKWGKPLAALYAGGCCMASLGMGNMAQTHAAAAALNSLGVAPWVAAVCLGVFVFVVARGGLTVGAKIAQGLVPAMTLLFFGASLGVLWVFRENLPAAFASIFQGAFSWKAGAGGTAGALLAMREGVSRGGVHQ